MKVRFGKGPAKTGTTSIVYGNPCHVHWEQSRRFTLGIRAETMFRRLSANKKLTALSVFVILILGFWAWDVSASLRGQIMAHFDVARGRYRQLAFGLAVPTRSAYARLLGERYGIEMRAVAGCIVSDSLIAYVQGYNKVSAAAANRKWGRDVFQESRQEAGRIWSRTHPDAGKAGW